MATFLQENTLYSREQLERYSKPMEILGLILFFLVYLGMMLGSWPGFALDRTGIALLGAIAFIQLQKITVPEAASYIDFSSLAILFSFMIISAQFYTYITHYLGRCNLHPSAFLGLLICISAFLSALLINDIVCLALTPLIIQICVQRTWNPVPFLIVLACSSNIGSAMTLVGNPQNLFIGQVLDIPFREYVQFAFIPSILSLLGLWLIVHFQVRGNWFEERKEIHPETREFDRWQATKGVIVITLLVFLFFITDLPRDRISLVAAGILLLSRKMASQTMLSFIDWQLLVLFIGLFIVNKSFIHTNDIMSVLPQFLASYQIDIQSPLWIVGIALVLSNLVSNVPAVMLLLPFVHTSLNGSVLALSSTFGGNLLVIGSIANLIVISQAAQYGIEIDWKRYVRTGFPVTFLSFVILIGWVYLRSDSWFN